MRLEYIFELSVIVKTSIAKPCEVINKQVENKLNTLNLTNDIRRN